MLLPMLLDFQQASYCPWRGIPFVGRSRVQPVWDVAAIDPCSALFFRGVAGPSGVRHAFGGLGANVVASSAFKDLWWIWISGDPSRYGVWHWWFRGE